MRRSWEVSRRALLRGTGTAIGLPFLEAMVPGVNRARAAGAAPPRRLVFFIANGGTPETTLEGGLPGSLRPRTTGANFETTPLLEPLVKAGLREDITVVTNLHNSIGRAGKAPGDMGGDHTRMEVSLLTAVSPQYADEPRVSAAISVDQAAANELKGATSLPSLNLQIMPGFKGSSLPMCWRGATSPVSPILKPSDVFGQLFRDSGVDPQTAKKQLAYTKSILHYAKADGDRLRARLGKADQQRLDQYLESIRSVEQRISQTTATNNGQCGASGLVPDDSASLLDGMKQMLDLTALALECDRTRVVVFQVMAHGMWFNWLGSPCLDYPSWHDDIEHGAGAATSGYNDADVRAQAYLQGCRWMVEQFGSLVRRLKDTQEADGLGAILDNSMLVYTSEFHFGNGHAPEHLPVILAGRGGRTVSSGRHLVVDEQPIANLWVTMLNSVGSSATSFGNSTGALSLT